MDSGYYAACAGLVARTNALEVIANNLANVNTSGYRGQQPTFRALLASAATPPSNPLNQAVNNFNILSGTRLDLSTGNLERTGGEFDLALEGPGFFVVKTADGTAYTRNGQFRVSAKNQLVSGDGELVLGDQGPLTLPSGPIAISSDGTISVNGAVAGKLRVVDFDASAALTPLGKSYYSAENTKPIAPVNTSIRQGMLEGSNVNPVSAAVGLISVQRHAEMMARALGSFYSEFNRIAATDVPRI